MPIAANFKMKLRLRNISRCSKLTDKLTRLDALSARNINAVGVGIGGDKAIIVLNQKKVAETTQFVSNIGDDTRLRGPERRAVSGYNIDTVIALAIHTGSKRRNHPSTHRP